MAKPLYKIGDVVQLKSGGPEMAIESVILPSPAARQIKRVMDRENEGVGELGVRYHCQWFNGKKAESEVFPEESLRLPKPDDNGKNVM
jgi:uncharacterized protein YodC (DUF2158 family)